MKMYLKLSIELIRKIPGIRELLILLYALIFISVITLVSAFEIKLKDFNSFYPYIKQNGVMILSQTLAKSKKDGGYVIRDENELADYLGDVKDLLCMEEVWETSIGDDKVETYCYSSDMIKLMEPEMREGRWFGEEDKEADVLKAVISSGSRVFNIGERLKIRHAREDMEFDAEVIGILDDRNKMIMHDIFRQPYGDYRDCFSVVSSELDDKIRVFLYDGQILAGEKDGKYPLLNYRISPDRGFQKQMKGITIITFDDDISSEQIDIKLQKLKEWSDIYNLFRLDDIKRASVKYVLEDLRTWIPLIIFIIIFDIVAIMSVNIIMTKKMMGKYAVLYLCGFTWKQNTYITLLSSVIEALAAFVLVLICRMFSADGSTLFSADQRIDLMQIISCFLVGSMIVLTAHIAPMILIGRTSVKDVFEENSRGGMV